MSERNTMKREVKLLILGVAASTKIEAGKMVAVNASGYAVEASDTAGLVVIGKADQTIDNSSGANGDLSVAVERGYAFLYKNSGTNAVTIASIGSNVVVEDDETVSTDTTNDIVAGKCMGLEGPTGVWVLID